MNPIVKVSLRQQAVFIPADQFLPETVVVMPEHTIQLLQNLAKIGYTVSEELSNALKQVTPEYQKSIWKKLRDIMGLKSNWAPLVKGWNRPTGEGFADHLITLIGNIYQLPGVKLQCGHIIPHNTFPLERYNGCPFCGTPFQLAGIENYKQGSTNRVLELWTEKDAVAYLNSLLQSKTALDATQADSLKILLEAFGVPDVEIAIKETRMLVIDFLVKNGRGEEAQKYFASPTDILRYLWFEHTGYLQLIEPRVIVNNAKANNKHMWRPLDQGEQAKQVSAASLKLKYGRTFAKMVATWMNQLPVPAEKACEIMHPKRAMWIRFIRALRLVEYGKKPGFEKLNEIMKRFAKEEYTVWQGEVDQSRLRYDAGKTFSLLKERPGLFARSLFSNMLWFGAPGTVQAFSEVIDKVPARLVLTLNMYAENYFDKGSERAVKGLGSSTKKVKGHQLLEYCSDSDLKEMQEAVKQLSLKSIENRFNKTVPAGKTIYIDPALFRVPLSIGDRSASVQDTSGALMGMRFPVEGDTVRLFMHWGKGLSAQHLDMDLSCRVAYDSSYQMCSYYHLVIPGCKHSGDIRSVPEKVGTAEYIDIDLAELTAKGAKYVSFMCNAYSNGSISPGLVVGWMNSKHPMQISERTGVAYDPSCVQHQVRITQNMTKGLLFGVLDIAKREVVWLEMPFGGQIADNLDAATVQLMMKKLEAKLTIGELLAVKAKAQSLELVSTAEADEIYDKTWAMDASKVSALLID